MALPYMFSKSGFPFVELQHGRRSTESGYAEQPKDDPETRSIFRLDWKRLRCVFKKEYKLTTEPTTCEAEYMNMCDCRLETNKDMRRVCSLGGVCWGICNGGIHEAESEVQQHFFSEESEVTL